MIKFDYSMKSNTYGGPLVPLKKKKLIRYNELLIRYNELAIRYNELTPPPV